MAQYTQFFIKTPQNEFLPIATYISSSKVAEFVQGAPYGHIKPLSKDTLRAWIEAARQDIHFYERQAQTIHEYLSFIERAQNPLEEKMERVRECNDELEEAAREKENAAQALRFFQLLEDMCEEAADTKYWTEDEDAPSWRLDPSQYVYYGRECSAHPTTDDII